MKWGIGMYSFFKKQLDLAKENINYFLTKIIVKILEFLFKISICLIINGIINNIYSNIICILFISYTSYNFLKVIINYRNIIFDIKNTLKIKNFYFEIDMRLIKNSLFRREENYGR